MLHGHDGDHSANVEGPSEPCEVCSAGSDVDCANPARCEQKREVLRGLVSS